MLMKALKKIATWKQKFEERSERHNRNHTEKGLQFDLEIGTKGKSSKRRPIPHRRHL